MWSTRSEAWWPDRWWWAEPEPGDEAPGRRTG
jgi:hypothetical protein